MTDWWEEVEIVFTPAAMAFIEGKTGETEDLVRKELADAAADGLTCARALVCHVVGDIPQNLGSDLDQENLILAGTDDGRIVVHATGWKTGTPLTDGPFAGMTPVLPDFIKDDDDDGTPSA